MTRALDLVSGFGYLVVILIGEVCLLVVCWIMLVLRANSLLISCVWFGCFVSS